MAFDTTPYGLSLDRIPWLSGGAIGASYKWLSGIGLALVAGISFASRWFGAIFEYDCTGKMSCNTTYHSLQFEVGLLFFSAHLSFGFSHGKRDDAYIAGLPKTFAEMLEARRKAINDASGIPDSARVASPGYAPDFGGGSLRQDN